MGGANAESFRNNTRNWPGEKRAGGCVRRGMDGALERRMGAKLGREERQPL